MENPPQRSTSIWSDLWSFLVKRPAIQTILRSDTPDEREDLSDRILQRLGVGVNTYSVLNLHKIGIEVPGRFIFDELMTWDNDSVFWPNQIARVKRVNQNLDRIELHFLGVDRLFAHDSGDTTGIRIPPLFRLTKLKPMRAPHTGDMDNARSLLYTCSGGYPIGIFSLYVRSSIAELGETETSQLFFMVAFDFYGKKGWFYTRVIGKIWEAIHNRVTGNVMNRIKELCESSFQNTFLTN